MSDMVAKGRQGKNKGSQCWNAKINEVTAATIIRLHQEEGLSQSEISRLLGLGIKQVHAIVTRKTWKHVEPLELLTAAASAIEVK